jgi:2-dehydropantoate 2-reductase
MRFLVLGAGAIGGLFGGKLLKGGADVTFLVRGTRAAQLQRDGLIVKALDGEIRTRVRAVQKDQIDATYDVILLCCKAYDLKEAIAAIAPAMGERSAVLPFLNGIRHIDVLTETFSAKRVLGGVTVINAALLPDGSIQQSHVRINMNAIGELEGGCESARCNAIKTALEVGGIPVEVSDNIVAMMWMKFFGFACNATIASLTRSRAGAIARSAAGTPFVAAVIEECSRVVTAEGYPPRADIPNLIRGLFSQPDSTYGPSLLVDMEEERATECEHTVGDLAERAERRGISAPILCAALCNLQAYEINRNQLHA